MTTIQEPDKENLDEGAAKRKDRLSFANDLVWSLCFDGFSDIANVVAFWLLSKNLAPAGYGAYIGLFGIVGPLGGLAWAGVGLAALQRIVRDEHDPVKVARAMLGQGMALALGGTLVAITIARFAVRTLSLFEISSIVFAELMALTIVMISSFILQGVKGVPAASRLRLVVLVIRVVVVVTLFFTDRLTIAALGVSTSILFSLLSVWVLMRSLPAVGLPVLPGGFGKDDSKIALSFSVPLVGSSLQLDGDKTVLNAYGMEDVAGIYGACLLYTSPSPRDQRGSRMPSSA